MIDPWDAIPKDFTLDDLDKLRIVDDSRPTKRVAVRLGLMCSFYMRNPHSSETRLAMAQCADHYQQLFGEHIKSYLDPYRDIALTPFSQGNLSLVRYVEEYDNPENESFTTDFYGDIDPYVATPYGLSIYASSMKESPIRDHPAYLTALFPFSWLKGKDGEGAFQMLMHQWCKALKPFHGYAGVGAIQSIDEIEKKRTNHLVYPLSRRFPGLEIDRPSTIASKMARGGGPLKIKGVNWLTALDDECFEQLGGREAVLGDLDEGFKFYEYDGGVLIQAGPVPQLGDVNQRHMPRYYQQLARKLKPIRMIFPKGHSLIKSPNRQEKSNTEASNEWLARFD